MLGLEFIKQLKGKNFKFEAPTHEQCDITKEEDLKKYIKPDISLVINCAAVSNENFAEEHPVDTVMTNILAVYFMARLCRQYNIELMHFGTTAEIEVTNVYSLSKKLSSAIPEILKHKKYYLFKLGWLFGGYEKDKNFIGFIVRNLKKGNTNLAITDNTFGSPTYAKDAVEYCLNQYHNKKYGTKSVTNRGRTTRYQLATEVAKILEISNKFKINNHYQESAKKCRDTSVKGGVLRPYKVALKEYLYGSSNF